VADAARLPIGSFLSINVSPSLLADTFVRTALAGDLRDLVIELTEEEAIADYDSLRGAMAEYRARGARFAIDDAGAGYASMRPVTELRPHFIKLDARLVTGLAGDDGRQALVRAMQSFAHDIGATLVAEGVETAEELALLARADRPILVQGYAVARPAPPWAAVVRLRPGSTDLAAAASRRPDNVVRPDVRADRARS
jgi:EAL domain-containing protein (putative c-di-GMP-specific phosphodiesterase class I)